MGWWIFEDAAAVRFDDGSSFGRHAYRWGSGWSEGPLPAYAFSANGATGRFAASFDGTSEVTIDDIAIPGPDFTWQAWCKFEESPIKANLLEVTSHCQDDGWISPGGCYLTQRYLTVAAVPGAIQVDGKIAFTFHGDVIQESVKFTCSWPIKTSKGSLAHLTVRRDVEGRFSLFRNGSPVGEPVVCTMERSSSNSLVQERVGSMKKYVGDSNNAAMVARLFDKNIPYKLTTGRGLQGGLEEVRLWSRGLSNAEIVRLSRRRVHNWAPRLTAYLRLNDRTPNENLLNGALGAEVVSSSAIGKPISGGWGIGDAPALNVPRALWLSQKTIDLGAIGRRIEKVLSIQFWARLDTTETLTGQWDTTAKNLLQLRDGNDTWLDLKAYKDGRFELQYVDTDRQTQDMAVGHLLEPGCWTHVTLVIEPSGATVVYRNGELIGREMNGVPRYLRATAATVVLGDIPAAITELRLWNRTLSGAEIQRDMHLKLREGSGLTTRLGLDNPDELSRLSSSDYFVEAPGLELSWDPPAGRPMVKTFCEIIPDQSPSGTDPPALVMDLQALDDDGNAMPNAKLEVLFESGAIAYRNYIAPENRLSFTPGTVLEVAANGQGKFRIAIALDDLQAPVTRIRHTGMLASEWNIVSPSEVALKAIYSVTAAELTNGPAGSDTTKPRPGIANTAEDGKQIESILRLLAAPALAGRFETETTEFLAFSDDSEDENPSIPTVSEQVAPGVHTIMCGENDVLKQRLSMPKAAVVRQGKSSEDAIVSFGLFDFFDDICDFVEDGVDWVTEGAAKVGSVVRDGITATFRIVDGVLKSVKYMLDTVVNGIKVAFEMVAETVADIAKAVWSFVKAIGLKIWEFMKFLFGLFDFGDFLEASSYMLDLVDKGVVLAMSQGVTVLGWLRDNVDYLGSHLTRALGTSDNRTSDSAIADGLTQVNDAALVVMRPLMWLLSLVTKPLEVLFGGLKELFNPFFDELEGLQSGVQDAFLSSATKAVSALANLVTNVDDLLNLGTIRNLAADIVEAVVDIIKSGAELGMKLVGPLFGSLNDILKKRLDIPIVTPLLELILGVPLTIGRIITLIAAVPTVLIYKLSRATSSSPFKGAPAIDLSPRQSESESVPLSFGDEDPNPAGEIALRGVGLGVMILTSIMDVAAAAEPKKIPVWLDITRLVVDSLHDGVIGCPHLQAVITDGDPPEASPRGFVLQYASWGLTVLGLIAAGIEMSLPDGDRKDEWGQDSQVSGICSGIFGTVNTVWDTVEAESELDIGKGVSDSVTAIAGLVASCGGLLMKPGPPQAKLVATCSVFAIGGAITGLVITSVDA